MAIIVVAGSAKGVGKTTLTCGLVAALPEFGWTAVKITPETHKPDAPSLPRFSMEREGAERLGDREPVPADPPRNPIWEENNPGQGTDTARFLAAGARRAFLVTAGQIDLPDRLRDLGAKVGPNAHLIFESNQVLNYVQPDLCLALEGGAGRPRKPSFGKVGHLIDARVLLADRDQVIAGAVPVFQLLALDRISTQMQRWLRERLEL